MADERVRYSDSELAEFKQLILKKLEQAKADYDLLRQDITHSNDTQDTSPTFKVLEDIIIPDDVRARLGIKDETIFGDDLIFTCANTGTGVIKLVMVGGGDQLGGGNSMGGMRLEKEIAIIVRGNYDIDPDGNFTGAQGWL